MTPADAPSVSDGVEDEMVSGRIAECLPDSDVPTGNRSGRNPSARDYSGGEPVRRKVGLSDAVVATDGNVLVTSGLGSCLGIALYHPNGEAGGLLHAMLPEANGHPGDAEKFVVEGIDALVTELASEGVLPSGLRAKLAGGAKMLELDRDMDEHSVGRRNVVAAEQVLAEHGVPIVAADTGGHRGRSLRFDTAEGDLRIVYAGEETRIL